jgi:hypothetical protein
MADHGVMSKNSTLGVSIGCEVIDWAKDRRSKTVPDLKYSLENDARLSRGLSLARRGDHKWKGTRDLLVVQADCNDRSFPAVVNLSNLESLAEFNCTRKRGDAQIDIGGVLPA